MDQHKINIETMSCVCLENHLDDSVYSPLDGRLNGLRQSHWFLGKPSILSCKIKFLPFNFTLAFPGTDPTGVYTPQTKSLDTRHIENCLHGNMVNNLVRFPDNI